MKQHHLLFFWLLLTACALQQSEAQTVYITKTGSKYHRSTCRYLSHSKISVSLEEAKKYYDPCSVCKPSSGEGTNVKPDTTRQQRLVPKPPAQPAPATSRQCTALTQSGLRCKRTTTNANGKCWQHQ